MLRKLCVPAILGLAGLLVVTDVAQAQRRGGGFGGRGSGSGSGGWFNNYVAPFVGGSGYYGNNNYGNYGNSGWYGNSNYGNSPYRSGWYSPYQYDYYPRQSYYYSQPATEYYYAPSTEAYSQPESFPANSAQIRVLVPDANARVWFDGNATQQTGMDRLFHTPSLNASATNSYRVRATWNQNGRETTQERVVNVQPGRTITVDFNQNQSEQVPQQQQNQQPNQQQNPLPEQPNQRPEPSAPATELQGRIIKTGQDQFVVETSDNRQVTVYTNPQTRFMMNDNPGAFSDLRVGSNINLGFRMDGTRHIANTVTIRP
jgi:uncharacterized protein (TIGR03000 family)